MGVKFTGEYEKWAVGSIVITAGGGSGLERPLSLRRN